MEWLHDAEDFSSSPGSLAGDESGSEIEELPVPLHHRHQNEIPPPSFDSPEVLASYVGSPLREHHGQALAFFDAADCPQTDEDDFADVSDADVEADSDAGTEGPADAQTSAIAEIFRCFICLGKVVEAQLCPCCSKICCFCCIKRWLTDQRPQCPHCRASLRVSQLVNCRFIADLSTELEKLQKKGLSETPEKACSLHNSPMSYYCNTCSDAVCSDCAVFGEEHRGHSFERLLAVYERHVETIIGDAVGLRRRLKDLCALVSEKDKNIERVHKAKDEAGMELQLAFEGMQARLEQQLKSKLLTLLAQKGSMTQEIEGLDSMMHDLNGQLNSVPKSELIARSASICSMLQEVQQRPTSDLNRTPVPADFISEVVPPYDQGEFVLHDFDRVLRRTTAVVNPSPSPRGVISVRTVEPMHGSNAAVNPSEHTSDGAGVVYSQPIQAAGIIWRLKVYPNGNGVAAGSYLSVFLEMVHGGSEPAKYEYKIEMLHRTRPQQSVIREFASVFEVGECWGYNRFFRLEVLKEEGYLLPEEDVITLRFHVRAPTYAQQCQDLRRALVTMEDEKSDAQKQADVLRRAFADTLWWKRRRKMPSHQRETAGAEKALEHDVSNDRSNVIIEQSDGETEAGHNKKSLQRTGKPSSGRKKGRGSGKRSREKLEERSDQLPEQCRFEVAREPLITQEHKEAEPSIVETDEEYVEASEPFSEEVWVPEIVQESTDVPAPDGSESHLVGQQISGLEGNGLTAKWRPLARGNEPSGEETRNLPESKLKLVDRSSAGKFVSAPLTLAGGNRASAADVDRAEPPDNKSSQSGLRSDAGTAGRRASATRDSREISVASTPDQSASEDSKQEITASPEEDSVAQQPDLNSQESGQPLEASREASKAKGSETRISCVDAMERINTEDLEGIIKMCLAPNTFKRLGLAEAQQLRRRTGDAHASGGSENDHSLEEPVSSYNESNGSRFFIIDPSRYKAILEEREGQSEGIRAENSDRVCAEFEGESGSSANVQRKIEGGCTATTSASDVLQKGSESALENDSDGAKENNVQKGDLTQLRLAARSPCFMERVAKVSLVDGKAENTCALSRPALLKSGLGVIPLGAELKSRLRSDTRPFVRGRERKTEESRSTPQLEDANENGKKEEGGSLSKLQFWRNNPFIKLPKVEQAEAALAEEGCQTSDEASVADRSLTASDAETLERRRESAPSSTGIPTDPQVDKEEDAVVQTRESLVEQLPVVDA